MDNNLDFEEHDEGVPSIDLENAVKAIKDWRNQPTESNDPCQASFNVLRHLITHVTTQEFTMPRDRHEIAIMGEQGAGKTSLMCSLVGQVNFLPETDTGTRVRTLVTKQLAGPQSTHSLTHVGYPSKLNREKTQLDDQKLFNEYESLTKALKDDECFSSGLCTVVITHTDDQEFGLTILDHPGVNASKDAMQIIGISEQTLKELFPKPEDNQPIGDQPNDGNEEKIYSRIDRSIETSAKVLIAVKFDNGLDFQNSHFMRIEKIPRIPAKNIVLVINKMDLIQPTTLASALRTNMNVSSKERYKISAWGILKYIKDKLVRDSKGLLSSECDVYFTASSSLGRNDLESVPPKERWEIWQCSQLFNTFKLYRLLGHTNEEIDNYVNRTFADRNDTFKRQLEEFEERDIKKKWENSLVDLIPMSKEESEKFNKYVGIDALRSAMVNHQFNSAASLARRVAKSARDETEKLSRDAKSIAQKLDMINSESIGSQLLSFMEDLIEMYHTLETTQISNNSIFKDTHNALDGAPGWGWKLEDELDIAKSIDSGLSGQFPPDGHGGEAFDESLLPSVARNANIPYHTAGLLLHRFKQEAVSRAMSISIEEVKVEKILTHSRNASSGVEQKSISGALSDFIARQYENIYGTEGSTSARGTRFISHRTGLGFLLPCEAVVTILCQTRTKEKNYGILFDSSNDSSGEISPHNPLNLTKHFREASRFLNPKHLLELDRSDILKTSEVTEFEESLLMSEEQFRSTTSSDVIRSLVSMFYDRPFATVSREFSTHASVLKQMQPSFIASVLQNAPFFLHHDKKYRKWYEEQDKTSSYVKAMFSVPESDEDMVDQSFVNLLNVIKPLSDKNTHGYFSKIYKSVENDMKSIKEKASQQMNKITGRLQGRDNTQGGGEGKEGDPKQPSEQRKQIPVYEGSFIDSTTLPFHQASTFMTRLMHALDETDSGSQKNLMLALLRLNRGPDLMIIPEFQNDLKEDEYEALKYLVKRYVSAANFMTVLSMLRLITNMLYEYGQVDQVKKHYEELVSRIASLMLGYDYPYAMEERPSEQSYLSHREVITILYRIVVTGDKNVLPFEMPTVECSPVVRWVLKMHESEDEKERIKARGLVESMYQCYYRPSESHTFHELIVREMSAARYQDRKVQQTEERLKQIKAREMWWQNAADEISAFADTLSRHGGLLAQHLNYRKEGRELPSHLRAIKPREVLGRNLDPSEKKRPPVPSYQFSFDA